MPHHWAENLKKGRTPEAARENLQRNLEMTRAEDARLARGAEEDPDDVVRALFEQASKATLKLMRKWNRGRTGDTLPRVAIDASRETRQLADSLYRILQARGAATEAREFFAEFEERLEGANLDVSKLSPYLEPPDDEGD